MKNLASHHTQASVKFLILQQHISIQAHLWSVHSFTINKMTAEMQNNNKRYKQETQNEDYRDC